MPLHMKMMSGQSASRQAGRQTDGQTDGQTEKVGDKYIWHSDSDIMPASCEHAHARACCVERCTADGGFT